MATYSYELRVEPENDLEVIIKGRLDDHMRKEGCWILVQKILDQTAEKIKAYAKTPR